MDAHEPRVRRRGFFLHSPETGEPDQGEHESAEGFSVRLRTARSTSPAPRLVSSARHLQVDTLADEGRPAIRSGSVTGSRQRAD